jgi:hypothetical protein
MSGLQRSQNGNNECVQRWRINKKKAFFKEKKAFFKEKKAFFKEKKAFFKEKKALK